MRIRRSVDRYGVGPLGTPAGLLRAGKNVLSYQGLKATADDENFLLQMGLVATTELEPTPAYLPTASPGSPNLTTSFRVVEDVQFSEAHGFYDESFELTLTTATANAKVIYTSDGSVPTLTNGTVYDSPLTVDSTTVFRAPQQPQLPTNHRHLALAEKQEILSRVDLSLNS